VNDQGTPTQNELLQFIAEIERLKKKRAAKRSPGSKYEPVHLKFGPRAHFGESKRGPHYGLHTERGQVHLYPDRLWVGGAHKGSERGYSDEEALAVRALFGGQEEKKAFWNTGSQEPTLTDRALGVAPAAGALSGAIWEAAHPNKGFTKLLPKHKLIALLGGAGAGATVGSLPEVFRSGYTSLFPKQSGAAPESLADQIRYQATVGSTGRGHPDPKDLDLLVVPKEGVTDLPKQPGVDVFKTTEEHFEPALAQWLRGKGIIHDKRLAKEKGYTFNRYGLHREGEPSITDLDEIYARIGREGGVPESLREELERWREFKKSSSAPISKYAARASTRQALALLEEVRPGITKEIKRLHAAGPDVGPKSNAAIADLLNPTTRQERKDWYGALERRFGVPESGKPGRGAGDVVDELIEGNAQRRRVGARADSAARELYRAHAWSGSKPAYQVRRDIAAATDSIRERAKGKHLPAADEVLLPSTGSAEILANPSSPTDVLFRGNALPEEGGKLVFTTRHPDVAAGYATGIVGEPSWAPVDGKLFAYSRSGAAGSYPEVHSHAVTKASDLWDRPYYERFVRDSNRTADPTSVVSTRNPTYEVPLFRRELEAPLGEYRVRPARDVQGNPAFAVRTVGGAPFAELLRTKTSEINFLMGDVAAGKTTLADKLRGHYDVVESPWARSELKKFSEEAGLPQGEFAPGIPYKLLLEANQEPYLRGYVRPRDKDRVRVPITVDGEIVGFHTPRQSRGSGMHRVGAIYVQPEHRGKGLAAQAIREHVAKHGDGIAFIETSNEPSRKAFLAAGFEEGDYEDRWGGGNWFRKKQSSEEFAPGIPASRQIHPIPEVQDANWRLTTQLHNANRAGKHWDLRLVDPETSRAHSWAVPRAQWPDEKRQKLLALLQPTHTADYAGWSGEIPEGTYGAGKVDAILDADTMVSSAPGKVEFDVPDQGKMRLLRTKDGKWLLTRVKTSAFWKSEKPTNLGQDFAAGLGPFGVWTSEYGARNQRAGISEGEHNLKQGVGIAGGLAGGGLLVPSMVTGLIEGFKGGAKGGWRGLGRGFLEGAAMPFRGVYHGRRATKLLDEAARAPKGYSRKLTRPEKDSLEFITGQTPVSTVMETGGNLGTPSASRKVREAIEAGDMSALTPLQQLDKGHLPPEVARAMQPAAQSGYNTFLAQLGIGAGIGGIGAGVQYSKGREGEKTGAALPWQQDEESHALRNSLMGVAAGVPAVTALTNRRAPLHTPGTSTHNFDYITANLKPGDIVLSGSDKGDPIRNLVAATQGSADYTHANVGWGPGKVLDIAPDRRHVMSDIGDAGINPERRVRILRHKDPAMASLTGEQDRAKFLQSMYGQHGDAPTYSVGKSVKSGLREILVPDPVAKLWGKLTNKQPKTPSQLGEEVRCAGGVCTVLPGGTMDPASKARQNKSLSSLLPRDIASDPSLETVLEYTPDPEEAKARAVRDLRAAGMSTEDAIAEVAKQQRSALRRDKLLRHAPNIARGAIGLGGAGAIYGLSKVNPEDVSVPEVAAGLGLGAAGAVPFLHKPLSMAAVNNYRKQINEYGDKRLRDIMAEGFSLDQAKAKVEADMQDFGRKIINDRGLVHVSPEGGFGVTADRNHPMNRGVESPTYDYSRRQAVQAHTPEFLAHELGHARDFENRARRSGALTLDDQIRAAIRTDMNAAPKRDTLKGALRVLRDETMANAYALQDLKKHRGLAETLRGAKRIAPAYSTYLLDVAKHLKKPGAALMAGGAGLGLHGLVADREKTSEDEESHAIRNSLMAAAAGMPALAAITNKRAPLHTPGSTTENWDAFIRQLPPGDVVLSGPGLSGNKQDMMKGFMGGSDFIHSNLMYDRYNAIDTLEGRENLISRMSESGMSPDRNVRILRRKDRTGGAAEARKGFSDRLAPDQKAFMNALTDEEGRALHYNNPKAIRAGLREVFVPDPVAKVYGKLTGRSNQTLAQAAREANCEGGICTTAPGGLMDRDSATRQRKSIGTILPSDIGSDDMYETITEYRPSQEALREIAIDRELEKGLSQEAAEASADKLLARQARRQKWLKHAPNLLRGAAAAGGAGAVYGASKINPEDVSLPEVAGGLGLAGMASLPFTQGGANLILNNEQGKALRRDLPEVIREYLAQPKDVVPNADYARRVLGRETREGMSALNKVRKTEGLLEALKQTRNVTPRQLSALVDYLGRMPKGLGTLLTAGGIGLAGHGLTADKELTAVDELKELLS